MVRERTRAFPLQTIGHTLTPKVGRPWDGWLYLREARELIRERERRRPTVGNAAHWSDRQLRQEGREGRTVLPWIHRAHLMDRSDRLIDSPSARTRHRLEPYPSDTHTPTRRHRRYTRDTHRTKQQKSFSAAVLFQRLRNSTTQRHTPLTLGAVYTPYCSSARNRRRTSEDPATYTAS